MTDNTKREGTMHRSLATEIVIEFVDAPPGRAGSRVSGELQPLRERPGHWAKVYEGATKSRAATFASQLRRGVYRDIDEGDFEATSRDCFVYARFVKGTAQ